MTMVFLLSLQCPGSRILFLWAPRRRPEAQWLVVDTGPGKFGRHTGYFECHCGALIVRQTPALSLRNDCGAQYFPLPSSAAINTCLRITTVLGLCLAQCLVFCASAIPASLEEVGQVFYGSSEER